MPDCVVCGRPVSVSDACAHCARPVCEDHRAPEAHGCPGVDTDRHAGWRLDPDADRERPTGGIELSNPRRLAAGLAVALLAAVALAAVLGASMPGPTDVNETAVERAIAAGVNDERTDRGLAPLSYDRDLARVAEAHSRHMLRAGYFNHTAPNGSTVADRYDRFGIDCAGGENIYQTDHGELGVTDRALAAKVVREFMRSPPHREAVLNPDFSRQGIGVVVGPDGAVYVTQNFC